MITPRLFFFFICLLLVINILCFSILIAGRFTSTLITVEMPDTTAGDMRGWTGGRPVPSRTLTSPLSLRLPPLNFPSTLTSVLPCWSGARFASAKCSSFPPPFSSPPAPHLPTPSCPVRHLRYAFRWL